MNIGFVIDLQLKGEHPYCGDRLDERTGFSYDSQLLTNEGIKCKNYGWKDMSEPESMTFMLNIVKDMAISIKQERKKVILFNLLLGASSLSCRLWKNRYRNSLLYAF